MKHIKNIAILVIIVLLFGACFSSRSTTGNTAGRMGTANTTSGVVDSIPAVDTTRKNN